MLNISRKEAQGCCVVGAVFDVFLFEEVPAQERSAAEVYLSEVDACDLYLGLLGESYGNVDALGVSATEREYERAEEKHKDRICFVKQVEGTRDAREARFVSRVNAERTRRASQTGMTCARAFTRRWPIIWSRRILSTCCRSTRPRRRVCS